MPDIMTELIPVNIIIADRSYRLKIEPADEEMVRKTAALINEKINSCINLVFQIRNDWFNSV